MGDRLFSPELWNPTKRGLAGGLALGVFIGLTPTMGVQVILAGFAAYFVRVNVAAAIAGSLVTNPFTAAVIYPIEYQIGVWLVSVPDTGDLEGASQFRPLRATVMGRQSVRRCGGSRSRIRYVLCGVERDLSGAGSQKSTEAEFPRCESDAFLN